MRRLGPQDSEAIAEVEARVHAANHRSGAAIIRAQLEETEYSGRNMSMGLYYGPTLVGYGLAFIMHDRREMATFFDVTVPDGIAADEPTIYLADYVVDAEHRRSTRLPSDRFAIMVDRRRELGAIAMDAFSTAEYADKWASRKRWLAGIGWEYEARFPYYDTRLNAQMFWITFKRLARRDRGPATLMELVSHTSGMEDGNVVCTLRTDASWQPIAAVWQGLRSRSSDAATLAESWEYVFTWASHFADEDDPRVLVAIEHAAPKAIAVFGVRRTPLGRLRRTYLISLTVAGVGGSAVLSSDRSSLSAIARALLSNDGAHDGLDLIFESAADVFAEVMLAESRALSWLTVKQPLTYHMLKMSDARSSMAVSSFKDTPREGRVVCSIFKEAAASHEVERYFALRELALIKERKLGVPSSSGDAAFHRALLAEHAAALNACVGVARVGDEDVAAALAFMRNGVLKITHVTQRPASHRHNAADALIIALVRDCHDNAACHAIQIPDLPYLALGSLNTHRCYGVRLIFERPTPAGQAALRIHRLRIWRERLQRILMDARAVLTRIGSI